jgi:perosamine synthetase
MSSKIYSYGKQSIDDDDIRSVVEVLKSDWLTQGPKIGEFEKALCEKFHSKYTSVVSNGTAGLHLIALALGWQKGDIVITSPITFAASANCAAYVGAIPDFADIDPVTYTIDVNQLETKIKDLSNNRKKVKAVVGVDYAGYPCDWEGLNSLAKKYGFQLVNDYCHALGAEYKGDFNYAAKYADAVNLSFHPVKHITSGEGGAVLTNSREIDTKIKILRTHGITKDSSLMEKDEGPWYYEMQLLGFNYRITDFQCALGLSQLKKLDTFIKRRREIAEFYNEEFADDDRFIIPKVSERVKHAYHLYPLQINFNKLKLSKKEYFEKLKHERIILQVHYIPIHLQPYYRHKYDFKEGDFPNAEQFYQKEVSIPIYPSLNEEDLNYISRKIKDLSILK